MRVSPKTLFAAVAFTALTGSFALAAPPADRNPDSPGLGWAHGKNKGAPGPVAGAGLSFLVIAGGYALVRRYRNHRRAE